MFLHPLLLARLVGLYPAIEGRHYTELKLTLIPRWSNYCSALNYFRLLRLCSCDLKEAEYAPKFPDVTQSLQFVPSAHSLV